MSPRLRAVPPLTGTAGLRFELKTLGHLQPTFGVAYVFPIDKGARDQLHWGIITSIVFHVQTTDPKKTEKIKPRRPRRIAENCGWRKSSDVSDADQDPNTVPDQPHRASREDRLKRVANKAGILRAPPRGEPCARVSLRHF